MTAEWIVFSVFIIVILIAVIGLFIKRRKGNRVNYTLEDDKAFDDFLNL